MTISTDATAIDDPPDAMGAQPANAILDQMADVAGAMFALLVLHAPDGLSPQGGPPPADPSLVLPDSPLVPAAPAAAPLEKPSLVVPPALATPAALAIPTVTLEPEPAPEPEPIVLPMPPSIAMPTSLPMPDLPAGVITEEVLAQAEAEIPVPAPRVEGPRSMALLTEIGFLDD